MTQVGLRSTESRYQLPDLTALLYFRHSHCCLGEPYFQMSSSAWRREASRARCGARGRRISSLESAFPFLNPTTHTSSQAACSSGPDLPELSQSSRRSCSWTSHSALLTSRPDVFCRMTSRDSGRYNDRPCCSSPTAWTRLS